MCLYKNKPPSIDTQETAQSTNNGLNPVVAQTDETAVVGTVIQPTATMMSSVQQQTMTYPGIQQVPIQQQGGMLQISTQQVQTQQIPVQNLQFQQPTSQLVSQTNGIPVPGTVIQSEVKIMNPITQQTMIHPGMQQQPYSNQQMMQQTMQHIPTEQPVITYIPEPTKPASFQYFDNNPNKV